MNQESGRILHTLPFVFFSLNCVAQNSIAEDGSHVSSTELELKFGETLIHIGTVIVNIKVDVLFFCLLVLMMY